MKLVSFTFKSLGKHFVNSKIRFEEEEMETGLKVYSEEELGEFDIEVISKEIQGLKGN
jgi:hypothetical protein